MIIDSYSLVSSALMKSIKASCQILILILLASPLLAQDPEHYDENGNLIKPKKGFLAGLYIGTYFANNHTASLYDGYGFDYEENRRTFEDSWMYEKIINQYGGGYGQTDYIAEALGVQPGEWNFDESDMPSNMRYKTAFSVGFSGRYSVDSKNAVLLNVTGAILTAVGNFTITTRPLPGSTQINDAIKTFNIRGKEQRLLFQAGYQHILGQGESFNLFVEGGLHATLAQFDESEIEIETLRINLYESYYNQQTGATYYTGTKPVGLGFGAFAGMGVNLRTTGKWDLQLLYNLSLENVRIGYDQKLKFNHAAGLRIYYKLARKE